MNTDMRPTGNLALSTAVLVSFGYVAQVGEFGDLAKLGVSDSNKVVRGAIQDAAPVAVTDEGQLSP